MNAGNRGNRYRTPLKDVRGLGSAKTGTEHATIAGHYAADDVHRRTDGFQWSGCTAGQRTHRGPHRHQT